MLDVRAWCFAFVILLFCPASLHSQQHACFQGSRAAGMSGASVAMNGFWAQVNNQAGMAQIDQYALAFHYENYYGLDPLSLRSVLFAMPLLIGAWGMNYSYFGDTYLNEQQIAFSYGIQLHPNFSLGAAAKYYQVKSEVEQQKTRKLAADIGFIGQLSNDLHLGVHISNISKPENHEPSNLLPPTCIAIGAQYRQTYYSIHPELDINFGSDPVFLLGLEIFPVENFELRFGIRADKEITYSFGTGYSHQGFAIDIAFSKHPFLGFSPYVSLFYQLKKKVP